MITKYFYPREFKCCCGNCYYNMSEDLLTSLDMAREIAKVPFVINSSWRCEAKNLEVGGKSNSAHLRGTAVDIDCTNSSNRLQIVDALLSCGFTRIGIAKTFIHADIDEELPNEVLWIY